MRDRSTEKNGKRPKARPSASAKKAKTTKTIPSKAVAKRATAKARVKKERDLATFQRVYELWQTAREELRACKARLVEAQASRITPVQMEDARARLARARDECETLRRERAACDTRADGAEAELADTRRELHAVTDSYNMSQACLQRTLELAAEREAECAVKAREIGELGDELRRSRQALEEERRQRAAEARGERARASCPLPAEAAAAVTAARAARAAAEASRAAAEAQLAAADQDEKRKTALLYAEQRRAAALAERIEAAEQALDGARRAQRRVRDDSMDAKHLRVDNARLLRLLASTREYRGMIAAAEDGSGAHFVPAPAGAPQAPLRPPTVPGSVAEPTVGEQRGWEDIPALTRVYCAAPGAADATASGGRSDGGDLEAECTGVCDGDGDEVNMAEDSKLDHASAEAAAAEARATAAAARAAFEQPVNPACEPLAWLPRRTVHAVESLRQQLPPGTRTALYSVLCTASASLLERARRQAQRARSEAEADARKRWRRAMHGLRAHADAHAIADLVPWRSATDFAAIGAALDSAPEAQNCHTPVPAGGAEPPPALPLKTADAVLFVAPNGDDAAAGTQRAPLRTLARAVIVSRQRWPAPLRGPTAGKDAAAVTIALRAGTYYLADTVELGPADSHLTIQSVGGVATLSGAVPLGLRRGDWSPAPARFGLPAGVLSAPLARNASAALFAVGAGTGSMGVAGLRVGGRRAVRARYPNADPEIDGFGSDLLAAGWVPPAAHGPGPVEVSPAQPVRQGIDEYFERYALGVGGPCARFSPPAGYWCALNATIAGGGDDDDCCPKRGNAHPFEVPRGAIVNSTTLPNLARYATAGAGPGAAGLAGAVLHAWRPFHWASWMMELRNASLPAATTAAADGADGAAPATTLTWSRGAFQGARGETYGGEMYIENVLAELDAPGEWWLDAGGAGGGAGGDTRLFFYPNSSADLDAAFEGTRLQRLLAVRGNASAPVLGLRLRGLRFADAGATFLEPHGMPSGGDWALHRGGALHIEGGVGTLVEQCAFERVDGTAVMVTGFNRNVTVQNSTFAFVGENAVALWGDTRGGSYVTDPAQAAALPRGFGPDGTGGEQPRYTRVVGNLAHHVGVWEKQSSFYFQAKSCQNEVSGNIVYDVPRAAVNFNDGFGGGSTVDRNLMFNTCRESGNHGVFNSWDRQVFVTDVARGGGEPSTAKLYDVLRGNFLLANFNADFGIDNDDASAYYRAEHNFLVYGDNGLKADFGGHDNVHTGNLYAYPQIGCLVDITEQLPGHELQFFGNRCVMRLAGAAGRYAHFDCADLDSGAPRAAPAMHDNAVFAPDGQFSVCGLSLAQLQARGFEVGTTVAKLPAASTVLGWAEALLAFEP
eukprot:g871.t1